MIGWRGQRVDVGLWKEMGIEEPYFHHRGGVVVHHLLNDESIVVVVPFHVVVAVGGISCDVHRGSQRGQASGPLDMHRVGRSPLFLTYYL